MNSKLNRALIRKIRVSLIRLAYYYDMLSMSVFTTRHWQMSGRVVQELDVCIAAVCDVGFERTVHKGEDMGRSVYTECIAADNRQSAYTASSQCTIH